MPVLVPSAGLSGTRLTGPTKARKEMPYRICCSCLFSRLVSPRNISPFTFPAQPVSRIRVAAPHLRPDQLWQVHELRVLNGGAEVPRSTAWRIDAWPDHLGGPLRLRREPGQPLVNRAARRFGSLARGRFRPAHQAPTQYGSEVREARRSKIWLFLRIPAPGRDSAAENVHSCGNRARLRLRHATRRGILMLEHLGFQYLFMKMTAITTALISSCE